MHYYTGGHHTPIYEKCGYAKEQWAELPKKTRRVEVLKYVCKVLGVTVVPFVLLLTFVILGASGAFQCSGENTEQMNRNLQEADSKISRMIHNFQRVDIYTDSDRIASASWEDGNFVYSIRGSKQEIQSPEELLQVVMKECYIDRKGYEKHSDGWSFRGGSVFINPKSLYFYVRDKEPVHVDFQ